MAATQSSNPRRREEALSALSSATIGEPVGRFAVTAEAATQLLALLEDPDERVVRKARFAVSGLRVPGWEDALWKVLAHSADSDRIGLLAHHLTQGERVDELVEWIAKRMTPRGRHVGDLLRIAERDDIDMGVRARAVELLEDWFSADRRKRTSWGVPRPLLSPGDGAGSALLARHR